MANKYHKQTYDVQLNEIEILLLVVNTIKVKIECLLS